MHRANKSCRPCCTRRLPLRPGRAGRPGRTFPPRAGAQPLAARCGRTGSASVGWPGDPVRRGGLGHWPPSPHRPGGCGRRPGQSRVVVDRHLKTSRANIYALGDCAEVDGLNLLYVMPLMSCARALAQTLAGNLTAVSYGAMPITVKTPVYPLVVSPPPRGLRSLERRRAGGGHQSIMSRCQRKTARLCPDRRGGDGKTGPQQRASAAAGVNTGRSVGITPLFAPTNGRAQTGAALPCVPFSLPSAAE